ncbi:hypothetical protein [Mycobacteroides abscessus]|uniref:hypothetical protein n=1 Tax=Mycobacteroides abscessus TaxID=36809 RepID=UPI002104A86A|nr:hypothetical protein [Mycobacteroides abscessus]
MNKVLPARLSPAEAGPRGWLTFSAPLPDELQRSEDATAFADRERYGWAGSGFVPAFWDEDTASLRALVKRCVEAVAPARWPFARPATDTERILLHELGYRPDSVDPQPLVTVVSFPSAGVRARRWPQLESESPE